MTKEQRLSQESIDKNDQALYNVKKKGVSCMQKEIPV